MERLNFYWLAFDNHLKGKCVMLKETTQERASKYFKQYFKHTPFAVYDSKPDIEEISLAKALEINNESHEKES